MCLFLASCHTKPTRNDVKIEKIDINIKVFYRTFDISGIYEAQFIPLESTEESLVGEVDKVIVYDSLIYVLDCKNAKKLFVFNMEGKFIRTIGKVGKGNGEYLVLNDFDIAEDRIYISSQQNNKMLVFNLNGQHIKDIKFSGYIGMNFKALKDKGFVVKNADGSNKSAIFYNIMGKKSKIVTNPEIDFMRYSNPYAFTEFNNDLYMYFAMNDTIYKIADDYLLPKYAVDLGIKSIPFNKIYNKKLLDNYRASKEYLSIMTFLTFPKYHFIKVYNSDLTHSILINKINGNIFCANIFNYKGFPIIHPVGKTDNGPIFLWGPPSIPIYAGILKKSCFIPKCFKDATINANPGIVILAER
jgi:hypothetical protein